MKFVAEVCGLKNVKVISPGGVPVGEAIKLECQFDTEDDQLYAVKWYKGKKEFYRYVPRDNPPGKVFSSSGVNVNVSRVRFRVYTLHNRIQTLSFHSLNACALFQIPLQNALGADSTSHSQWRSLWFWNVFGKSTPPRLNSPAASDQHRTSI